MASRPTGPESSLHPLLPLQHDLWRKEDHKLSSCCTTLTGAQSVIYYPTDSLAKSSTTTRHIRSISGRTSSRLAPKPVSRYQGPEIITVRVVAMDNPIGLVDADGVPITYTPTTHRISKAKKGKKVHVCEFGCGKVRDTGIYNNLFLRTDWLLGIHTGRTPKVCHKIPQD